MLAIQNTPDVGRSYCN